MHEYVNTQQCVNASTDRESNISRKGQAVSIYWPAQLLLLLWRLPEGRKSIKPYFGYM